MKIPEAVAAARKEWNERERIPVWDIKEGKSKANVVHRAKRKENKHTSRLYEACSTHQTPTQKKQR